jgi:hypothetical protein
VRPAGDELIDEPPDRLGTYLVAVLDAELGHDDVPVAEPIDGEREEAAALAGVDRFQRHAEAIAARRQVLDDKLVERFLEPVRRVPGLRLAVDVREGGCVAFVAQWPRATVLHGPELLRVREPFHVDDRLDGRGDGVHLAERTGVKDPAVLSPAPSVRCVENLRPLAKVVVIACERRAPVALPHVDGERHGGPRLRRDRDGDIEVDVDVVVALPVTARRVLAVVENRRPVLDGDLDVDVVLPLAEALGLVGEDAPEVDRERAGHDDRRSAAVPQEDTPLEVAEPPRTGHTRDRRLAGHRETERPRGPAEDIEILAPDVAARLAGARSATPEDRARLELGVLADDDPPGPDVHLVGNRETAGSDPTEREEPGEDVAVDLARGRVARLVVHPSVLELLLEP